LRINPCLNLSLVRQDAESRAYRIGPAVAALAARYAGDRALLDAALPVLEALRGKTGLWAQLGALEGGDVVYLLRLRRARAQADRAAGHVVQLGEFQRGIGGIAAPVRRADGNVVAALSLVGPAVILRTETAVLAARIRGAAAAITPA